jgi:hypothetical protein
VGTVSLKPEAGRCLFGFLNKLRTGLVNLNRSRFAHEGVAVGLRFGLFCKTDDTP